MPCTGSFSGPDPRGFSIQPSLRRTLARAALLTLVTATAGSLSWPQGTPIAGGCSGGALGAAHDQPGALCEDFDSDRNGTGKIEWSRLPRAAHPCDPMAALFDPSDDLLGYSLDGGAIPLGTDGRICSEDAAFPQALGTCHVVPTENDWHLHGSQEGCDTDDSYDLGSPQFAASCAPSGEWAHSGLRSLHLGRHLGPPGLLPDMDTYRFRQTSAFVLEPVFLGGAAMLEFWQIIQVCDDSCVNIPEGTTAGGQIQVSLLDAATGLFGPWQRLTPSANGYDTTAQAALILCEFDPGDDLLAPGDETMCLDASPQFSDIGDIHGTDRSCTTDTDLNDPVNLDCGRTTSRAVDAGCSWVADPSCGSFLENGSVGGGVWARTKVDLAPLAGSQVRLRFAFQGGGGWAFGESRSFIENETEPEYMAELDDGWYIDDIRLTGVLDPDPLCADLDQDGFSCSGDPSCACALQTDCGCDDPLTWPGAPEICDRIDNDCDTVVPPDEIDGDGDGLSSCEGDCAEGDPANIVTPAAVSGLSAAQAGSGTLLAWNDQGGTAGADTRYDIHAGLLSELRSGAGFGAGRCERDNIGALSYTEHGTDPAVGDGRYFIVRGQNGCPAGDGTWGDPVRDAQVRTSAQACD